MKQVNFDEESSFNSFRREVNKFSVLTEEEQNTLLKKYQETGDFLVLEEILKHNLRLSIKVAKKYIHNRKSMDIMDLIQECNISLILAIETYEIEQDAKFSTYAMITMTRNLITAIVKQDDIIKKPAYLNLLEIRKNKYISSFFKKNNRYPTEGEIKENLNISDSTYKRLLEINKYNTRSLNEIKEAEEEKDELQNFIEVEDTNFERVNNRIDDLITLKATKLILTEKEYYVIYNRILIDQYRSRENIGKELNLSRETIRQIEVKGLSKLKKSLVRKKTTILEQYTVEELEKEKMEPLSLNQKCLYLYLKENLKEEEYYYIYTRNIKQYGLEDYKKELKNISEQNIIEQINTFDDIYNSVATPEFIENNFKAYKERDGINNIFKMSIEPELIKNNKNKTKKCIERSLSWKKN